MREIKFRAWNGEQMLPWGWITDMGCVSWVPDNYKNDYEIMQYTGLKDKNGVDIYEGDIVDYRYSDMSGGKATVKYENGCFEVGDGYVSCLGAMYGGLEVIGNIYENKELLK